MGERAPESLRPSGKLGKHLQSGTELFFGWAGDFLKFGTLRDSPGCEGFLRLVFVLYLGSAVRNVASDGGRSCWMHEGIPDVSEQISTGLVLVRFPPQQSPVRSGSFEYCYGASRPCCHLGPGFSTSEISQTLDSFNGIDPYAPVADCRCVPYLSARTHFEASGFRLCLPIGQLVQRALFLKQRLFNATQLAGFEPTSQLLPMRRFIFRTVPATSGRIGGVGIRCSQCSWCQSQLPTIFVDAPLLQLVVSLEPLALGTISGGQWDVTAGSRSGGSLDFRSAVAK